MYHHLYHACGYHAGQQYNKRYKYDEKKKCYSKHGYFCCWECTKSFNFETRDVKSGYRSYLIHQICRQYYGINQARSIKYARHLMELKKFGGNIDDEQFLKEEHARH